MLQAVVISWPCSFLRPLVFAGSLASCGLMGIRGVDPCNNVDEHGIDFLKSISGVRDWDPPKVESLQPYALCPYCAEASRVGIGTARLQQELQQGRKQQ